MSESVLASAPPTNGPRPFPRAYWPWLVLLLAIHGAVLIWAVSQAWVTPPTYWRPEGFLGVTLAALACFGAAFAARGRYTRAIAWNGAILVASALLTPAVVLVVLLQLLNAFVLGDQRPGAREGAGRQPRNTALRRRHADRRRHLDRYHRRSGAVQSSLFARLCRGVAAAAAFLVAHGRRCAAGGGTHAGAARPTALRLRARLDGTADDDGRAAPVRRRQARGRLRRAGDAPADSGADGRNAQVDLRRDALSVGRHADRRRLDIHRGVFPGRRRCGPVSQLHALRQSLASCCSN